MDHEFIQHLHLIQTKSILMEFLNLKILFLFLSFSTFKINGSEFRILNFDKCKGHENYLIIEQCEGSGNVANARANFTSTIDSIIVSKF